MLRSIKYFFQMEAASSVILLVMALLAMAAANSPLLPYYEALHEPTAELVINKGLMALFFLYIGIEIKLEIKEGSLASPSQIALPMAAALGGIIVPALIYIAFNRSGDAMRGWAIPTATDIAFSLGVLNSFGKTIPRALRIFLMSIAIFDDLAAIAIIAVFYTQHIYWLPLLVSAAVVVLLYAYNRRTKFLSPFIFAGCALWVALLDSGINPTIAAVVLGLLLPLPLGKRVLRFLHGPVAFFVVPLFIFANSGIPLAAIYSSALSSPAIVGITSGLFIGKQMGIFIFTFLMIRFGLAKMPPETTWMQLYAVAILCGIGFTMSLFIGSLAFGDSILMLDARIGVLTGSLASAVAGAICMALSMNKKKIRL